MKVSVFFLCVFCLSGGVFAAGARSFDKSSYRGTVWSQANPWFSPHDKLWDRLGGTDLAWHRYSADKAAMWKEVAEVCHPYGLSGLQMEVSLKDTGDIHNMAAFKPMLDGFQQAGNGFRGMPFVTTMTIRDYALIEKQWDYYFDSVWPLLSRHPSACRVDGRPVLTFYRPDSYSLEHWKKLRGHLEKKYGPVIFLLNSWSSVRNDPVHLEKLLEVFDGVSAYGNFTLEVQQKHMKMLSEIMKRHPDKIFEACIHNTYTQHYNYGGIVPEFTEKFRGSLDCALAAEPDSLVMTNFYDIYENSRILPSYEYEDLLLELMRFRTARWRGEKYTSGQKYNFYLSNHTSLYLGEKPRFELLVLPGSTGETADVVLEVLDAAGKILYSSPELAVNTGEFLVHIWTLPALKFTQVRELYPRLKINGTCFHCSPPTLLSPTMRSHLLWYSRSLKNQLRVPGNPGWTLCGGQTGSVLPYPANGVGAFRVDFAAPGQNPANTGGGRLRLLRNGRELASYSRWNADAAESIALPNPGEGCDAYALELVNAAGARYRTPSIFVSGRRIGGLVKVPVFTDDARIEEVLLQEDRVPCFWYPVTYPCGSLLVDCSGYSHDGFMGGRGYGGGHLRQTGYRHEHNGGLQGKNTPGTPVWKSEDQTGCLGFSGKEFICIQGGTAFPYAMTVELMMRPQPGPTMGVLGAGNQQLQLMLRGDGRLLVRRSAENTRDIRQFVAKETLPYGEWSHVALVYDCRKMTLWINGRKGGEMEVPPVKYHRFFNAMVIGATCRNLNQPDLFYRGDLRNLRIYGRNLSPREFLFRKEK